MGHLCDHPDHHAHHDCSSKEWLRLHDIRVTEQRLALVDFLRKTAAPRTLAEIHHGLQKKGGDFATVFRFIQILEKKNLVQQHYWEDTQVRYEINEVHHHYLICRLCHKVEPIDDCLLAEMERRIQTEKKYLKLTHRLEFFGICPQCQNQEQNPKQKRNPKTKPKKTIPPSNR